jgi:hypothetical protein
MTFRFGLEAVNVGMASEISSERDIDGDEKWFVVGSEVWSIFKTIQEQAQRYRAVSTCFR